MAVLFKTFEQIEIDGVNAGNIVDVISNHGPRRAEVLAAFKVYCDELVEDTNAEKAQLQTTVATLEARIAALLAAIPFDPRVIDATAFVDRIQPGELLTLFSSPDATTQQIAAMIQAYKTNDWPILLDSPEFQQAVGYLVQTEAITEQRAIELRRDATQSEAYSAEG